MKGGENIVKKVFFISILILFLTLNIVAAEDSNNATVDVASESQAENVVLQDIEIDYVQLNTSDASVFSKDEAYNATLTYDDGTPVFNKTITFDINGVKYNRVTDNHGVASLNIRLNQGTYVIATSFTDAYDRILSNNNYVYVSDVKGTIIPEGLSNIEIQKVIDSANAGDNIIFAGKNYDNVSLTISNNPVNIYSSVKSTLNGNSKSPVFTITSSKAAGTIIYNLIIQNGSEGILLKSTNNITVINNDIVKNSRGISVIGTEKANIIGNLISNSGDFGIYLKDSTNTYIYSNCITNGKTGIYFDKNVEDTDICNNEISYNENYGINLHGSGPYTTITGNNISYNYDGINVDCKGDSGLVITNNAIHSNDRVGLNIGENYVRSSADGLMGISYNYIGLNGDFNILARENDLYDSFKMGPVLTDGSDVRFVKICNKIKTTLLKFNVKQVDKSSVQVSVDGITTAFPILTLANDGSKWVYSQINNGNGLVHISNANGVAKFGYYGDSGRLSYTLSGYEPYSKPSYPVPPADPVTPTNPTNPTNPSNPGTSGESSGNGTSTNTQQGQGSATSSGNGGSSDGSLSVSGASSSASASAAAASSSSASTASASESSDSSSASQSASSSQSVAKFIDIDDEVVKIAGLGILILLIIAVIGLYYRNDIKSMIEKKNGK